MDTTTWQVTENNAGGLTLYVWQDDDLIYAHTGYERSPGQLGEDIAALQSGGDPIADGWEGNDLVDEDVIRWMRPGGDVTPLTMAEYYDDHESTKIICDDHNGPVSADHMGSAGREAFYPDEG